MGGQDTLGIKYSRPVPQTKYPTQGVESLYPATPDGRRGVNLGKGSFASSKYGETQYADLPALPLASAHQRT
jgi:hypothetical protein